MEGKYRYDGSGLSLLGHPVHGLRSVQDVSTERTGDGVCEAKGGGPHYSQAQVGFDTQGEFVFWHDCWCHFGCLYLSAGFNESATGGVEETERSQGEFVIFSRHRQQLPEQSTSLYASSTRRVWTVNVFSIHLFYFRIGCCGSVSGHHADCPRNFALFWDCLCVQ